MDEVIFLEELEGEDVHARHRLERFPVTVGRGYTNDVILDDPKVSASHLRIERTEDGRLVLRDVGSHNGTFRVEPWARLAELELTDDARVAVGDTVLRFRGRSHVVEDTRITAIPVAPRGRPFEHTMPEKDTIAGARGAEHGGIAIHSQRMPGFVAHHEIAFGGHGQSLRIRHDSNGRDSFIPGVLMAVREVGKRKELVYGLDKLVGL